MKISFFLAPQQKTKQSWFLPLSELDLVGGDGYDDYNHYDNYDYSDDYDDDDYQNGYDLYDDKDDYDDRDDYDDKSCVSMLWTLDFIRYH